MIGDVEPWTGGINAIQAVDGNVGNELQADRRPQPNRGVARAAAGIKQAGKKRNWRQDKRDQKDDRPIEE
jgi:hypothetical protein